MDASDIKRSTGEGDRIEFHVVDPVTFPNFCDLRFYAPSVGLNDAVAHIRDPDGEWRPLWFGQADLLLLRDALNRALRLGLGAC